jgi:UDP-N-acetyl-2-amino-2-deoxyglucuronate dehydrogenase
MKDKINFAVVGCGHIGKRHAEMVQRNTEAELVALVDTDQQVLKSVSDIHPGVSVYSSIHKFLDEKEKADVICIATPNGYHTEQALQALEQNLHVVIEKPMGLKKADAERVIFKGLEKNRNIFCVMQNRYSPPSAWLKDIMRKDLLGRIFMVQVNCYWNRDENYYKAGSWHGTKNLDGGTLFTQFSHFIDLMYWLFGDIKNIKANFADFNHAHLTDFEDSGMVTFEFLNGGLGCINYSTSVYQKNLESSMTIIAENGSVKVGGQYMDKIEYCHIKDYTMPELKATNPPNDYGPYKGSAANHHYIIENVIDVLKGRNTITTNALEGLKVVDIIERIYTLKG